MNKKLKEITKKLFYILYKYVYKIEEYLLRKRIISESELYDIRYYCAQERLKRKR